MSRTIDPAEALVMLKKHQPNFDRMAATETENNNQWLNEIAMLERRVESLYEMVDLGNGDKIAVRTALSEDEMEELGELEARLIDNSTSEEKTEIAIRQLELLTANPILTADWFRENKDKWPLIDALSIIYGFAENKVRQQKERIEKIRKFRDA